MARKTKQVQGRVTAKGTSAQSGGRYTAPIPPEYRSSPWWIPTLMLACFGLGVLAIILNYVNVLPGGTSNIYLLVGLVLIIMGFIFAAQYR